MLINKLYLHNFGLYAGENIIDFDNVSKDKPIILFGGMNGRGKTTILEAILLALYGRRSFAFLESKLSYPAYLKKYVNKTDGTLLSRIELTFTLSTDDYTDYITLRREWNAYAKDKVDTLSVHKNYQYDKYLSENWSTYIEDILPSGISRFFFFDGEKIADIAEENTDDQMKDSIKTLLGIDTIDRLIVDLKKVILKKREIYHLENYDNRINELNKSKTDLMAKVDEIKQRIKHFYTQQEQCRRKLEAKEAEFIRIGGSLGTHRAELSAKKAMLINKIEDLQATLIEYASGPLPLMMVTHLLQDIKLTANAEQENKIRKLSHNAIKNFLLEFQNDLKNIKEAASIINKYEKIYCNSNETDTTPIYSLSDSARMQIEMLDNLLLDEKVNQVKMLIAEKNKLLHTLDEIKNYLEIDVDDKLSNRILTDIKAYSSKIAEHESKIDILSTELTQLESEITLIEKELDRLTEEALKNLEEQDDSARIVRYANLSIEVMNKYKYELQAQKTIRLSEVITECFKEIIDKKSLISRIEINPQSLEFTYYDVDNEQILKSQLSAGEKQLLVIAMLWALAICSRKSLPVIIDTPLGRLDSLHRTSFLVKYLPKVSGQVIVLSTDEEINGRYYNIVKPYVHKEYLLNFNPETRSTKIVQGYFNQGGNN